VNESKEPLLQMLQTKTKLLPFNHLTKFPFQNNYLTKNTLGLDRIALIAAAVNLNSDSNVLIISLGTCVTFEFLNRKKEYLGGAISPGLDMRLQALNHFTAKLPSLTFNEPIDFNGNSTESCMQSGAFFGLLAEIKSRVELYEEKFGETEIVLSGGNCFLFEKHLKKALFAHQYLTLFGLNKILTYNV
jgi:type III pantothenate kinase